MMSSPWAAGLSLGAGVEAVGDGELTRGGVAVGDEDEEKLALKRLKNRPLVPRARTFPLGIVRAFFFRLLAAKKGCPHSWGEKEVGGGADGFVSIVDSLVGILDSYRKHVTMRLTR